MNYDKQTLREGYKMKQKAEERPTTFAEYNGADAAAPDTADLQSSNDTRKAGQKGLFALELMTNPEAGKNVAEWNSMFAQSVPGFQFNQAKMQMGIMPGPPAPPPEA